MKHVPAPLANVGRFANTLNDRKGSPTNAMKELPFTVKRIYNGDLRLVGESTLATI